MTTIREDFASAVSKIKPSTSATVQGPTIAQTASSKALRGVDTLFRRFGFIRDTEPSLGKGPWDITRITFSFKFENEYKAGIPGMEKKWEEVASALNDLYRHKAAYLTPDHVKDAVISTCKAKKYSKDPKVKFKNLRGWGNTMVTVTLDKSQPNQAFQFELVAILEVAINTTQLGETNYYFYTDDVLTFPTVYSFEQFSMDFSGSKGNAGFGLSSKTKHNHFLYTTVKPTDPQESQAILDYLHEVKSA